MKTLDLFEYANDLAAQVAYPTNGHHPVSFVGTAQLDTASKKFGSASLLCDGNSDWIQCADSVDWDIFASNSTNWTISFFIRLLAHSGEEMAICQNTTQVQPIWYIRHLHGWGWLFEVWVGSSKIKIADVGEITDTNWHHIALCKVANKYGLYKDGSRVGYVQDNDVGEGNLPLLIASRRTTGLHFLNGQMDDIFIENYNTFGVDPASADPLTVPTAAHQANTYTKLLLHFDGSDGVQATKDWSRLESRSEASIKQQGSYSLGGFAKGTDSLNDTLIRDVTPTVNLSDLPIIKFYVRSTRTGNNIKISIKDSGGTWTEITPNITTADVFQLVTWDISGVSNANKDAINTIKITIVNAAADNTFYLDSLIGGWPVLTFNQYLALDESLTALSRELSPFTELLALKEDLVIVDRGLSLEEKLALVCEEKMVLNSVLTEAIGVLPEEKMSLTQIYEESLGLLEQVTSLDRGLTLAEKLAFKEEAHADMILFEVDEDGNIDFHGDLDFGGFT